MTAVHKLGLLGALYLAQGLPFGFFSAEASTASIYAHTHHRDQTWHASSIT